MGASQDKDGVAAETTCHGTALLIIDMISDWDFPDAEALLPWAHRIAPRIQSLKQRCRDEGIAVIYANDNHGRWRSDYRQPVNGAMQGPQEAIDICRMLAPQHDDYVVLKPKHSAFFATPLHIVLDKLRVEKLILTGVTTDQCVLITATDARMHEQKVWCPRDCVATLSDERQSRILAHMHEVLGVCTDPSTALKLPLPD